jgi:REP-associated tyrosine transposase
VPRQSRPIFPGVPHHVTQRGNHREPVFFEKGDEEAYLSLLHAYSRRQDVEVTAYCLMPNHVHLVVVPKTTVGLQRALRAVHSQYAQRVNRMRELKGHLWQGRYFSSPLDSNYYVNAVRYVELNPVRAGLVARAQDYRWSSARAHCGMRQDLLISDKLHSNVLAGVADWSAWLATAVSDDDQETLRRHSRRNLPCGSTEFIAKLEALAGRELRCRPRGGQRRDAGAEM